MIERSVHAATFHATADLADALVASRRYLHEHPEVGFEEVETAAYLDRSLRALGLTPVAAAGTGCWVDIVGERPGPFRLYRADIDALPIHDAKRDVPYASRTPGVAHLCGHDAHTAIGLGVARLLAERRATLAGTVRVFFQPNEEGVPSGAPAMIADGVLAAPDGSAPVGCVAVHVDPALSVGQFGFIAGPTTASVDRFDVTVRSTGSSHSARPHLAPDPVWLATLLMQHAYTLAGRVSDARQTTVLSIGILRAGSTHNVIPAEVSFGGTLRSLSDDARRRVQEAFVAFATALDTAHGTDTTVVFEHGSPPVVSDARLVDLATALTAETLGEEAVVRFALPSMGAEDFAYYTQHVPSVFIRVGTKGSPRTAYPVHDARFDIDEAALAPAARLMADLLVRIGDPS